MANKQFFLKKIVTSSLFVSILFFLLLQLPIFNYGFNYRDEGYLLNNAQRINSGEIPYVDFSLAITPGSFYIQALALKLFGNYIITDRILYVLCIILVLVLNSRLFKFPKHWNYISLLFLALIYTGIGAFASYNMYGVVFVMTALFLFHKLKNGNKTYFYSFLIGLTNSLVFITKQTYGFIFFFTLLFLIVYSTRRKDRFKNILFYFFGSLLLPAIILLVFYFNGILNKLVYNVFYFALAVKNDRLPFITTSILFIPLFMFMVNFIKKITPKKLGIVFIFFTLFIFLYIFISPARISYLQSFYKQQTIYYFLLFFTVPLTLISLFFKSKNAYKKLIVIISIEAFSLFLASAFSGRDYTTVIVTAPLYIPLFLYLFTIKYKKFKLPLSNISISLLLILFIFPSILSLTEIYGKLYGIGYRKEIYANLDIKEAKYIKIPINQKNDLELVTNYIKSNASSSTKLLCVPYCSFWNFLGERKNASYFSFFYKFNKDDQDRVIDDLKRNDDSVILVQRPNVIEKEANYEDENLNLLKTFIYKKHKLVKTTENFYIYR
ncbi:MAG: hypothetical protein AAB662_02230 [Patescibacteria group bacterium]